MRKSRKNVLNCCYFFIWALCSISVFSSFKVEKIELNASHTIQKGFVFIASQFINLIPEGNNNFIFHDE